MQGRRAPRALLEAVSALLGWAAALPRASLLAPALLGWSRGVSTNPSLPVGVGGFCEPPACSWFKAQLKDYVCDTERRLLPSLPVQGGHCASTGQALNGLQPTHAPLPTGLCTGAGQARL